jgi:hypothetical protein
MSRGALELEQDDSSSDWLLNKVKALRRLLDVDGEWPVTGDKLLADLAQFNKPSEATKAVEDNEMLSIVVNDALMGIDIMKKFPGFYSRMLVDEELRATFLDTLELLEQSRAGELPEYLGPANVDLSFLQKVISKPTIRKTLNDKWQMVWKRSVEQLQNMFYIASLQPGELFRSDDSYFEESYINILHSQVEVDERELEVRLDALQTLTEPENLDLMLAIFAPEDVELRLEAKISWGDYQHTAEVNKYGLAKFPPLKRSQVYSASGKLTHGLELQLNEVAI